MRISASDSPSVIRNSKPGYWCKDVVPSPLSSFLLIVLQFVTMTALTITNVFVLLPFFGIVTAQDAAICNFECMHDSGCGNCDGDATLGNVELCRYGEDGKGRHCQCQTGWAGLR